MPNLQRLSDGSLAAYAWPGGYPLYYVCRDNTGWIFFACADCANKAEKESDDVRVVEAHINWEDDDLYCEDCTKPIECAYH